MKRFGLITGLMITAACAASDVHRIDPKIEAVVGEFVGLCNKTLSGNLRKSIRTALHTFKESIVYSSFLIRKGVSEYDLQQDKKLVGLRNKIQESYDNVAMQLAQDFDSQRKYEEFIKKCTVLYEKFQLLQYDTVDMSQASDLDDSEYVVALIDLCLTHLK
jgi:hypothetical protein